MLMGSNLKKLVLNICIDMERWLIDLTKCRCNSKPGNKLCLREDGEE